MYGAQEGRVRVGDEAVGAQEGGKVDGAVGARSEAERIPAVGVRDEEEDTGVRDPVRGGGWALSSRCTDSGRVPECVRQNWTNTACF